MTEEKYGIAYNLPNVTLLKQSGLEVSELAARTCYDSFRMSENDCIKNYQPGDKLDSVRESELLDSLAWVHQHHSVLEHTTISYLVRGTSRGCLQEHARHRIQAISVRSTRYTMNKVIFAFLAVYGQFMDNDYVIIGDLKTAKRLFHKLIVNLDMFVIADPEMLVVETNSMFDRLVQQYSNYRRKYESKALTEFVSICLSKDNINTFKTLIKAKELSDVIFEKLCDGKAKRNAGDPFKHIVTDNWKVDMVITFNLRSLKNYFSLRDSGAAYFQIRWLAKAMKEATPNFYLKLIDKKILPNGAKE